MNLRYKIRGVIISSEEERVINLFKMLTCELAHRKERLATEGVSSFVSYLDAGFTDLPQIHSSLELKRKQLEKLVTLSA